MRTLQCFQIFFFFAHKNLKKPPSKVAHQARTFFPTAQPTANSPKSIFHNMKMSHQASVLSSVVRCKLGFSKIENTIIDDPYVQKFDFFSNWFIFKKFFDGNKIILLNVFFSFVDFSSLRHTYFLNILVWHNSSILENRDFQFGYVRMCILISQQH